MHAKPEKVRVRRLKRQLKAAVSIGVALCAGVFLACQKTVVTEKTEDAQVPPEDASLARDVVVDVQLVDSPPPSSSDAAPLAIVDADGKSDALAKRPPSKADAGAVDKREHRKGMPVPDNLLE